MKNILKMSAIIGSFLIASNSFALSGDYISTNSSLTFKGKEVYFSADGGWEEDGVFNINHLGKVTINFPDWEYICYLDEAILTCKETSNGLPTLKYKSSNYNKNKHSLPVPAKSNGLCPHTHIWEEDGLCFKTDADRQKFIIDRFGQLLR